MAKALLKVLSMERVKVKEFEESYVLEALYIRGYKSIYSKVCEGL